MRFKTGLLASVKVGISRFLALSMVLNSLSPMTVLAAENESFLPGNSDYSVQATASDASPSQSVSSDAVTASASDAFLYDEDGELMDGIVIMDLEEELLDGEIPFEEATAANAAPEVIPPEIEELVGETAFYVNPLYEDVVTEEDLLPLAEDGLILNDVTPGLRKNALSLRGTSASEVAGSLSEAGAILRDGMIDRVGTVSVSIDRTAEDFAGVDPYDLYPALFYAALEESSDPRSGDYILYQYAGYRVGWGGSSTQLDFTYTITYYTDSSQEAEVTSRVSEVLQELDLSGKNELEKIAAVYDYITAHVTYDYDNLNNDTYKLKYTAYAALINGTAVCQGYANLFYRLCREAGLSVHIISGIGNGGNHAWNIVRVGQLYYNIDTTWDAGSLPMDYDYFLRTDDNFGDHQRGSFSTIDYTSAEFYAEHPMATEDLSYPESMQVSVEGVTLTPAVQYAENGEWATFNVTVYPENAFDKTVTYDYSERTVGFRVSYNNNYIKVMPTGDSGYVIVTVTTNDGGHTATARLNAGTPVTSGTCGTNATWEYDMATGMLTIGGTGSIQDYLYAQMIPWNDLSVGITKVVISEGITHIGRNSFKDCAGLNEVEIPVSVTSVGANAFDGSGLTSVVYSGTQEEWNTINIAAGNDPLLNAEKQFAEPQVVPIASGECGAEGNNATWRLDEGGILTISGTGAMADITVSSSPTGGVYIMPWNDYADSITQVIVEDGITHIGNWSFHDCTNITSAELPDSVTSIGDYAFRGCTGLEGIDLPDQLESIGSHAFWACESFTEIELPDSLTSLGTTALGGCTGLTYVSVPDNITSLVGVFHGCSNLERVDLPSGLTSITEAFRNCTSLEEITLPAGLTNIGAYTFENCSSLPTVNIPSGVTSIGIGLFDGCSSLNNIVLPSGVTSIGDRAFRSCSALETLVLPSNLTSIGKSAFYNCSSLTAMEIPSGVTELKESTFFGCSALQSIVLPDSITSIGTNLLYGCESLQSIDLPDSITSIPEYALYGCKALTEITIPANVTLINRFAFAYCEGLTEMVIPDTVNVFLGAGLFMHCTNLESVHLPASVATAEGGELFSYCGKITEFEIPSYYTTLGTSMFSHTGITEIVIPKTVTKIQTSVFSGTGLTDIYYPGTEDEWNEIDIAAAYNTELMNAAKHFNYSPIQPIATGECGAEGDNATWSLYEDGRLIIHGTGAMVDITVSASPTGGVYIMPWNDYADSITQVIVEDGITHIGNWSFHDCTNITSAELPDSVISIGDYAFRGCTGLEGITLPAQLESIGSHAFWACESFTEIELPDSLTSIGRTALGGCTGLTYVSIPDNITSIVGLFHGCSNLERVDLPSGLTNISEAFRQCTSLEEVTLPEGLTDLGSLTFENCSSLPTVNIPSGVTSIGYGLFEGCSSLNNIVLPSGVTSIGDYAFQNCSSLEELEIPSGVTSIGKIAFSGCSSLTSIEIPSGVTQLKENTFFGCSALQSIVLPNSITSIGRYLLYGCESLQSIDLPDSITSIPEYALYGCKALTEITIPASVTSIDRYAFAYCEGLTEMVIPDTVNAYLGAGLFSHCTNLESVSLPAEVATAEGGDLFSYCGKITEFEIPSYYTTIGSMMFAHTGITEIVIPMSITKFASFTFSGCGLTDIYYPGTEDEWNEIEIHASGNTEVRNAEKHFNYNPDAPTELKITSQPVSVEVSAVGEIATFTVEAEGEGLQYSWYHKNPSQTQFFKTGAYESSYSLAVTAARDGRQMYCEITDAYGNMVTTDTVTMSIHKETVLKITQQPVSVEVSAAGETATFTVEAEGEGLQYSWYHKNPSQTQFFKTGAYESSYSLAVTAARDGRQMYCEITDAYGNMVTTDTVTMSIHKNTELRITTQPVSVEVSAAGETATFTVEAEGEGLQYSWYHKNPGQTQFFKTGAYNAAYSLAVTAARDGRQMYCVITDAKGESVTTDTVTMSIHKDTELRISQQPVSVEVSAAGETATFTVEAEGVGLEYCWYHKNPGQTQFFKSGAYNASYSMAVTAARDGRQMYCVITDAAGNSVTTDTVTMSIHKNTALRIAQQPVSVEVSAVGETATFTVEAEGVGLEYCWYHKNPGQTQFFKSNAYAPSYSMTVTAARNGRQMYCVITDANGESVTTDIVTMTIAAGQ